MKKWVLALLPLALPWGWVCFGDLAGAAFHLGVSMRWSSTHGGLASGSSRSLASRFEQLVSLQGASDSMPHFSPEGVVVISGFWHSGTGVAPGNVPSSYHGYPPGSGSDLSVSTFSGWFSVLKELVLKCQVLPFSWALTLLA